METVRRAVHGRHGRPWRRPVSDLCGCILGLGWVYPRTWLGVFLSGFLGHMGSKTAVFHSDKLNESTTMVAFPDDQNRPQHGLFQARLAQNWTSPGLSWPKLAQTPIRTMAKDTMVVDPMSF